MPAMSDDHDPAQAIQALLSALAGGAGAAPVRQRLRDWIAEGCPPGVDAGMIADEAMAAAHGHYANGGATEAEGVEDWLRGYARFALLRAVQERRLSR